MKERNTSDLRHEHPLSYNPNERGLIRLIRFTAQLLIDVFTWFGLLLFSRNKRTGTPV